MNLLTRAYWTAKGVGWENLPRRVLQMLRQRSGLLRRHLEPARFSQASFASHCDTDVQDQAIAWRKRQEHFLPMPIPSALQQIPNAIWTNHVLTPCHQALAGDYPFFSAWTGVLGWPPNFNRDPVNEIDWPVGQHWMTFARSGPPRDDIKLVWEPSRFTLAYHLARAYRRDGDEQWAEAFWTMFDAWREQNPPQLSAAWACGQEMTFRLMAMLFAAFATLASPAATADRLYALTRLAWQTGRHIETNINFARSQGNNHAISEAVGLWTIGLLFPEFTESERWQCEGEAILASECRRQVYDDGSYVQNSMNYHRVMMDDLLWTLALAERNRIVLPTIIEDRFSRATDWLVEMIDENSGRVPNYGANDGANVLPLSCSDYLDYRPTAQAASMLLHGSRFLGVGPWDEKALWLLDRGMGILPMSGTVVPAMHELLQFSGHEQDACATHGRDARATSVAFPDGGYYLLRGSNSWAMTRCHTYRRRPSQADMLHVDLWMDGLNILRDAGSYAYYHRNADWMHYFHSTAAHNTVEIDGLDQMTKGSRFLWFNWTRSRVLEFTGGEHTGRFVGEHYGYTRLPGSPIHRRTIECQDDRWTISDEILGNGVHDVTLRWRLAPLAWQATPTGWQANTDTTRIALSIVDMPNFQATLIRPNEQSPDDPMGSESLYYQQFSRRPMLVLHGQAALPVCLSTLITRTASSTNME